MTRERPTQRGGQFHGQPYKLSQAEYAGTYGVTILTVKRWWKRHLPCDDPDAMGEYISNAGRKPDPAENTSDHSDTDDRLAESRLTRLDATFVEGEGLVAAIKRINKIEIALADSIRDELNQPRPDVRKLLNRLAAWTQMLEAMRKLEKDTPGILEQHKKQIDIGEVEEGVTRLLLAIIGRLQMLPTRAMQTLAGFTDPQDIREFLEKEIDGTLAPIRDCAWMPEQFRSQIAADESASPNSEPHELSTSVTRPAKRKARTAKQR